MGNVRVAHYLASFHKNVIFVKTRHCFIYPPSLAEKDCVQGWTRYKSSRCLYANCARCTVSVQTRVDQHTRTYAGQRLAHVRNLKICKDFGVPRRLHIRLMTTLTNGTLTHFLQSLMVAQFIILLKHFAIYKKVLT